MKQILHQEVSKKIHALFKNTKAKSYEEMDLGTLKNLRYAYCLVNEHNEVLSIDNILTKNNYA